jgi:MFS family permease
MHTLTHRALLAGIVAGSFGQAASADRGAASGIYLACYFFGGLIGSAILGQLADRVGWTVRYRHRTGAWRRGAARQIPAAHARHRSARQRSAMIVVNTSPMMA